MWGNAKIVDYWKKQRDMYKYIHDQSVQPDEQGLHRHRDRRTWSSCRRSSTSSGTTAATTARCKHNTRAVYQRYMGFYDANPPTLDQLPPEEAAKKYVEYMGGAAAVLQKAKADFDKGEYRWVAEALKHVVFADPNNKEAQGAAGRHLRADGLPGRIRPVALGLPAGRVRAAQRRAEGRRHQHGEPRHDQGHAAGDDVRLFRACA